MRNLGRCYVAAACAALAAAFGAGAQEAPVFMERLPAAQLDVAPPTSRVRGVPGAFALQTTSCRAGPVADARRRIVDIAAQEWAYFGFAVMDETDPASWARPRGRRGSGAPGVFGRGGGFDDPELRAARERQVAEAIRVAPSIAGYWAVTGDGAWIVERYNDNWRESGGAVTRWRDAWSAAFVSWVMCEAGFADKAQFQRDVAHHVYIDQAIRARDGAEPKSVLEAYELGEQPIVPGDLVCLARRPGYRTLADRREQMGEGARTHCDFVVKVDDERALIYTIGGNVRGTVGLKLLPAERGGGGPLRPVDRSAVEGAATTFVHLKLDAPPIGSAALDESPTLAALPCELALPRAARVVAAAARSCLQPPVRTRS